MLRWTGTQVMTRMPSEQPTLRDLVVDEEQLNEELLADVLSEYVRIGEDSGALYQRSPFGDLNSYRKTAVVLLAQHAKAVLGMSETEWLSPSEIADVSGMKKGTVYPAVRKLEERGLAEGDGGSYRIPAPMIKDASNFIEEGSD